ncbi:MAG: hypothetical protein ACLQU3_02465, partial [Limisphaerales bacterium]
KLDWEDFMAGLSNRDKAILQFIAEGRPLASLARRRHRNPSTITYHRRRLALKIQAYFGPQILADVLQLQRPRWKDSINCIRQKLACKERRPL